MPMLIPVLDKPKPGPNKTIFLKSPLNSYLAMTHADALHEEMANQVKLSKEAPQRKLDSKANSYPLLIRLDDSLAKGESLFIYLKSEDQLETLRNTLLSNSQLGTDYYGSKKPKDIIKTAVNLRNLRMAEAFLDTASRNYKGFQKEPQFQPSKVVSYEPAVPVKKKLSIFEMRSVLRRLALFMSFNREYLKVSEEEFKQNINNKMKFIQVFFKEFARKKTKFERKKIIDCMRNKTPASNLLLLPETQLDNADYGVIHPRAYFEISTDFSQESFRKQDPGSHLFKIYLLLTNEIYSKDVLPYYSSQELSLIPVPGYLSMHQTEFRVAGSEFQGVSLHRQAFRYLLAYKVDCRSQEIVAIGFEDMPAKKVLTVEINLKPVSGDFKGQGTLGKLVLCNETYPVDHESVRETISGLFASNNFSYLKKFYALKHDDPSLSRLLGIFGLKKQFAIIRKAILQSYLADKAMAEKASVSHDLYEWERFENFVEKSVVGFNRRILNDAALSLHTLPPVSEIISDRGAIVHTENLYQQLLATVGLGAEGMNSHASPREFLFFGRSQWHKCKDLESQREPLLKAMVTGMPKPLYLLVWKSLGKIHLMKLLIRQIISSRPGAPLPSNSQSILQYLQEQGKKINLESHIDCKRALDSMKTPLKLETNLTLRTESLVKSYLALSEIMEEYEPDFSNQETEGSAHLLKTNLLAGLVLRRTSNIVTLAHKLYHLYEDYKSDFEKLKQSFPGLTLKDYGQFEEGDVFYMLISICVVFLPEHFLSPLPNYPPENKNQLIALEKLGLDLDHVFESRIFVSSSAIGDYKLALLFAECVRKSDQVVFDRMINLGFPFATFCLEVTENLFCDIFNDELLCKIWNLIFFEGSANAKRRGQQALLSGLVCLVKCCKNLILESQSSQEIIWHLKTYGLLTFESTDFISNLVRIQRDLFVQQNEVQVVTWLEDIVNLNPRLETQLQKVKEELNRQLEPVASCNYSYLRLISEFSLGLPKEVKLAHLQRSAQEIAGLLLEAEVRLDRVSGRSVQALAAPIEDSEYILATKPQISAVSVSVAKFQAGAFLATASNLTLRSSVSNQKYLISLDQVPFVH